MLINRRISSLCVIVSVCTVTLINSAIWGQCELDKLLASDGAVGDFFGRSVSISGTLGNEIAIIGVFLDDDNGSNSGSAYIYRFNGVSWDEEEKLTASDGAADYHFGHAVSISGALGNEVAIVGTLPDDEKVADPGSAYIYRFNPDTLVWDEEQKLTALDGALADFFGVSVSINGDVAIIGASDDDDNGHGSGSAYIFRFDPLMLEWFQEAKLTASDGAALDDFGESVSISGTPGNEVAIVGAKGDDDNGLGSGSAYVFVEPVGGWMNMTQTAKLTASDGAADDRFGQSVSISGTSGNEVAIVGAHGDDDNGDASGSAFVFEEPVGGWVNMTQTTKLHASDATAGDQFGKSVSISSTPGNEVAIVGAHLNDDSGSGSGSAYIYRFNGVTWDEEQKLLASDGADGDLFGFFVSIGGASGNELAIVGAYADDDNGNASGSAYVFELEIPPFDDCNSNGVPDNCDITINGDCNANGIPDDCDIDSGFSLDCNGNGVPDDCDIADGTSPDSNGNLIPDDCEFTSRLYSLSGPGNGIGWSWCVSSPSLGTVCCLFETGVVGTTLAVAQHFADSINAAPVPEIQLFAAAIEDLGTTYLHVRVNFLAEPELCVGLFGGPTDCCPTFRINDCAFNPMMQEEPISPLDCNGNGQSDTIDIIFGISLDLNNNGIPDECECPWDLDGSGSVGTSDLLELFAQWGTDGPADFDESGAVGTNDLLILFANWGPCE